MLYAYSPKGINRTFTKFLILHINRSLKLLEQHNFFNDNNHTTT